MQELGEMKRFKIKPWVLKLPGRRAYFWENSALLTFGPLPLLELRECTDASNEFRRLPNSILISIAPYSRDHFRLPCQTNTEKLFQTLITCAAKPYLVTLVSKNRHKVECYNTKRSNITGSSMVTVFKNHNTTFHIFTPFATQTPRSSLTNDYSLWSVRSISIHSWCTDVSASRRSRPESLLIIACTFSLCLPQLADALKLPFNSLISRFYINPFRLNVISFMVLTPQTDIRKESQPSNTRQRPNPLPLNI